MPGRPQKYQDELTSKQRDYVHKRHEEGEAGLRHGDECEDGMGDISEVQVDDRSVEETVRDLQTYSPNGGNAPSYVPVVHGRPLESHLRAQTGEREGDKGQVQGKVPTHKGEASQIGGGDEARKASIGIRLLGWLSKRVGKRIRKRMEKTDMANVPAPQPPNGSTPEIDPSKFLISKNIMNIITHSVIPVLCVIIFNIVRAAKPEWLWPENMDQHAIDQISSAVNELLTAVSLLCAAWGHVHDVARYTRNKDKNAGTPPTT